MESVFCSYFYNPRFYWNFQKAEPLLLEDSSLADALLQNAILLKLILQKRLYSLKFIGEEYVLCLPAFYKRLKVLSIKQIKKPLKRIEAASLIIYA